MSIDYKALIPVVPLAAERAGQRGCWVMANVLDFVEPGPLLSDEVVKPPIVSKATVQRCISKLSSHWTDEQLDQVIELFQAHGLIQPATKPSGLNAVGRWVGFFSISAFEEGEDIAKSKPPNCQKNN